MKASIKMEAMRLAKNIVRDAIKRQGIAISSVNATNITKAAKAVLELMPNLYDKAEYNLKEAKLP